MPADLKGGHAVDDGQVRGTQSFVATLSECWRRPSLTGLEVSWRWAFGIPVLLVLWREAQYVAQQSGFQPSMMTSITVTQPMDAAAKLADLGTMLWPPTLAIAMWLAPVLVAIWVVVSSLGRTVVLRHYDAQLRARPVTLMVLTAVRVVALSSSFVVWLAGLRWAAQVAVMQPLAHGGEPKLVLYFALTIVSTLGLFVLWALVSWVFSVAPLLVMLRGLSAAASLRAATRLGPLRGKLAEINLVMGIVKIALIVLAMVLSACPLPFESVATPEFMHWWYVVVTVLYLLGSDFFHVARLVAYLRLYRAYEPA